jgi:hypothetical protein
MKNTTFIFQFAMVCFAIALLSGCSHQAATQQQALDAAKIPDTVNQAFAKATDDTKQQATSYVQAFQGQDAPAAFEQLKKLSTENNLSTEQRSVVARAMQTTFQQLQVAAQNGDARAKATMHQYLSSR